MAEYYSITVCNIKMNMGNVRYDGGYDSMRHTRGCTRTMATIP